MYRNHEHYPDPTAGEALAHICYEERQKRRNQRGKRGAKNTPAGNSAATKESKQQQSQRSELVNHHATSPRKTRRKEPKCWVLAYPKPAPNSKPVIWMDGKRKKWR